MSVGFSCADIKNGHWIHRPDIDDLIIPNVADPLNDTWHRITIHFRCRGAPEYQGLSTGTGNWKVIIDGIDSGELLARGELQLRVDFAQWESNVADTDYHIYVDAIGYSWDDDYNIDDNLEKGLLLSFENSTILEWMGYSIDGFEIKPILGNTTIPFPDPGSHSIQIIGNDSLGFIYQSNIRYFTRSTRITIITPENKTYVEAMSGYYPGTYGFESDKIGSDPTGFTIYETGGTIEVIEELGDHRNVVDLYDKSGKIEKQLIYFLYEISDLSEIGLQTERVPKSQLQLEEVDWAGFMSPDEAYPMTNRSQLIILDRHLNI